MIGIVAKNYTHRRVSGYNEAPTKTMKRFLRYVSQLEAATDHTNSIVSENQAMRPISENEKIEELERLFFIQNAERKWGNDGKLNKSVRKKLAALWDKTEVKSVEALTAHINSIENVVLPITLIKPDVNGEHWQKSDQSELIFELGRKTAKTRKIDTKDRRPKGSKRQKSVTPTKWDNAPDCQFGFECRNLINKNK